MEFAPAIKWSGSKRPMAKEIIRRFPSHINTYYEPFCGGASVLRRLLETPSIEVKKYICSDLNEGLIKLWNSIKDIPEVMAFHYGMLWKNLNEDEDLERKKRFFSSIRERYNEYGNPGDFLFIMRTCTNGMPRYNSDGKFNNSFHITRKGIEPESLRRILLEWSSILNKNNVIFINQSYDKIVPDDGDFVFLDPPYNGTRGMYFGGFDVECFFNWMHSIKCPFALTFDGKAGNQDNTYPVPRELYDKHEYIPSGNSSFRRVIGNSNDTNVLESLYTKGCSDEFRLGV